MSFAVQLPRQRAFDLHEHVLALLLQERLRGEHVLHFRRTDAVRQRAERAVRGRVRVAATVMPGSVAPCSGPMICTIP